jgi:hypothetical protein
MPNNGKTLRNLRLKPGAAYMKQSLNAKRPRIVSARNFFPDVHTARPTISVGPSITPPQVSVETMFPGPKKPSAFNLDPATLRLRKRQENAVKASEGQEALAFPMNESQGGIEGGRRKTRKNRHKQKKTQRR